MAINGNRPWWRGKEGVLMGIGIAITAVELVNAEILGRSFHYEFLVLAAGAFGFGLAQLGDRR